MVVYLQIFQLNMYLVVLNIDEALCNRASSVYSILLLLIRDSNNYKIRMHAAVALAVPVSRQG
jgi:hypothetical protein